MSEFKKAGKYTLKEFKISNMLGKKSVSVTQASDNIDDMDVKMLVYSFAINESMNSDCLNGSAKILDGIGLYYDFPLRGEEKLTITYEDFFGEEISDEFFIYSVTDLRPFKNSEADVVSYNIHFVSVGKFIADTRMVRKSYEGPVTNMVVDVFDKCYSSHPSGIEGTKKELDTGGEEGRTEGEVKLVVPNFSASETMAFFARNAYGGEDKTSSYSFFETREKYWFTTIDHMISKDLFASTEEQSTKPTFEYSVLPDETPLGQYRMMQGILSLDMGTPFNTLNDLESGSYHKRTIEIDYLTKRQTTTDYSYYDSMPAYNEYMGSDGSALVPQHTREFVDAFLTEGKQYLVLKDYPDEGNPNVPTIRPKTYAANMISPSWANIFHHNTNSMNIKVYGRNTIFAGETVEVLLDEFRVNPSRQDDRLSGTYIVESISNEFIEDTYTQVLYLSRGGVGE